MMIAIFGVMMPMVFLSGFAFPIENMPTFFQYLTAILPARWFMDIIRGVFLQGATLTELFVPFAFLIVMNVLFIRLAVLRFKKDLEP